MDRGVGWAAIPQGVATSQTRLNNYLCIHILLYMLTHILLCIHMCMYTYIIIHIIKYIIVI